MPSKSSQIEISLIDIPDSQGIRLNALDEEIGALAETINVYGLIHPITLRSNGKRFLLTAGRRRLAAVVSLGWEEIPAMITEHSEEQARAVTIIENLARQQLSPIEEAAAIGAIIQTEDPDIDELGLRLGKSRNWIDDRLFMLEWPGYLQKHVHAGEISVAAAKTLMQIPDEEDRERMVGHGIEHGITARTASLWLQQWKSEHYGEYSATIIPPAIQVDQRTFIAHARCFCCQNDVPTSDAVTVHICPTCITQVQQAQNSDLIHPAAAPPGG